jgi:hypothetical protein
MIRTCISIVLSLPVSVGLHGHAQTASSKFASACALPTSSMEPRRKTVDALVRAASDFVGGKTDASCDYYERVLRRAKEVHLVAAQLTDISALEPFTQIEVLDLSDNDITNIDALRGMVKLTSLKLGGNFVSDISPISKMTELVELDLGGNVIVDVSPVNALVKLEDLNLSGNQIVEIGALSRLNELVKCQLQENQIRSLNSLSGLSKLYALYVSDNKVNDISSFVPGPSLWRVNLSANPVPSTQIDRLLSRMQKDADVVHEEQTNYHRSYVRRKPGELYTKGDSRIFVM